MTRRLVPALLIAAIGLLLLPAAASAHPLGNFTTNTSAGLISDGRSLELVYVVDRAEVPTQQAARDIESAGGAAPWAARQCAELVDAQRVSVDGEPLTLGNVSAGAAFVPGDAGLDTLRLRCDASAAFPEGDRARTVTYADAAELDRIGWREVVAAGDGAALLDSDVPIESPTQQLRAYPDAEVSEVTSAAFTVDPSGAGADDAAAEALRATDVPLAQPESPGGLEGLVASYTELVARQDLTVGFVLLAIVLAIGLGTAHAVAPGHGKTVIAAYLLGEDGQAKQAVALGSTVAITHTIGVLTLGVLVQTTSNFAPERLYPVLGIIGGALFTALGVTLLVRALRNRGHSHDHAHEHHDHGHDHHAHGGDDPAPTGWRMLVLPGLAGGMVPSPSALLVLLGGIAIGRAWFGVVLVLAYGVGMALALVGAGYLLHRVRFRVMDKLESPTWARISAALPVATSSLIVLSGVVIMGRSALVG